MPDTGATPIDFLGAAQDPVDHHVGTTDPVRTTGYAALAFAERIAPARTRDRHAMASAASRRRRCRRTCRPDRRCRSRSLPRAVPTDAAAGHGAGARAGPAAGDDRTRPRAVHGAPDQEHQEVADRRGRRRQRRRGIRQRLRRRRRHGRHRRRARSRRRWRRRGHERHRRYEHPGQRRADAACGAPPRRHADQGNRPRPRARCAARSSAATAPHPAPRAAARRHPAPRAQAPVDAPTPWWAIALAIAILAGIAGGFRLDRRRPELAL